MCTLACGTKCNMYITSTLAGNAKCISALCITINCFRYLITFTQNGKSITDFYCVYQLAIFYMNYSSKSKFIFLIFLFLN